MKIAFYVILVFSAKTVTRFHLGDIKPNDSKPVDFKPCNQLPLLIIKLPAQAFTGNGDQELLSKLILMKFLYRLSFILGVKFWALRCNNFSGPHRWEFSVLTRMTPLNHSLQPLKKLDTRKIVKLIDAHFVSPSVLVYHVSPLAIHDKSMCWFAGSTKTLVFWNIFTTSEIRNAHLTVQKFVPLFQFNNILFRKACL